MVYFNKEYPQNHTMKLVNKNKDLTIKLQNIELLLYFLSMSNILLR